VLEAVETEAMGDSTKPRADVPIWVNQLELFHQTHEHFVSRFLGPCHVASAKAQADEQLL